MASDHKQITNTFRKLDWFDWSEWGRCSVSCGNGFQTRHRACIDIVTEEQRPACTYVVYMYNLCITLLTRTLYICCLHV
jgi:hypothetical protein